MYTKTEAVILKKTNYTNKDVLVTAYTKKWGKRTFLARGLRKPKAKLVSSLHPLRVSLLNTVEGKSFPIITGAEILEEMTALENNFFSHALALYIAEIIDRFHPEPKPQWEVFTALRTVLKYLNKLASQKEHAALRKKSYLALFWFILFLLKKSGLAPQPRICVGCAKKLTQENRKLFSPQQGGVVCEGCRKQASDAIKTTAETLGLLEYLLSQEKFNQKAISLLAEKKHLSQLKQLVVSFCHTAIEAEPTTRPLVNL